MNDDTTPSRAATSRHDDGTPIPGPAVPVDAALPVEDAPLSALIGRLMDDLTLLLRQEVELAKSQLRRDATEAAKAGGLLGAGVLLAFIAALLLAWAAAWGLATVMPTGLAFLVVAVLVGAGAAGAIVVGRNRLTSIDPVPHQSIDSIQRDQQTIAERRPA